MNIKLPNGTQLNLDDLNQLENGSTENGLAKFFDKFKLGGNGNNVFDKKEIEKLKAFLKEMAGADGVIDQNDIKNIKLKYSSIFEGYTESSMADDISMLNVGQKNNKSKNNPVYKVKSGDTVDKIVSDLGYSGADAKKYKTALIEQLKANNSFINDKQWLMAGANIELLSDSKLKELGISKPHKKRTETASENKPQIQNNTYYKVQSGDTLHKIITRLGYKGEAARIYKEEFVKQLEEDKSFINDKQWLMAGANIRLLSDEKLKELGLEKPDVSNLTPPEKEKPAAPVSPKTRQGENPDVERVSALSGALKGTQTDPVSQSNGREVMTNSPQRILEVIGQNGQKGRIINESELSGEQKRQMVLYSRLYHSNPQLIKNDTTGEVHIFFDTTDSPTGKKLGMTSIETVFSDSVTKTNRYYANGKIVQDMKYPDDPKEKRSTSTLIQAPRNPKITSTKKIMTALPIDIKADESVYADASDSQKEDINTFLNTLKTQKASLMSDLNIDNDTYNRLAKLACAVAMQETEMGKSSRYKYYDGLSGITMAKDTVAVVGIAIKKLGANAPTAVSKGLTQIKIGDWDDNPRIEKLFAKYGIKRGYYNTLTPEQSASATIIVLNELAKQVKRQDIQNGIEAANDNYCYTKKILKDGEVVTRTGGYFVRNHVTEDDAMMYLYNGRAGTLKKGNATPDIMLYTHNIKRFQNLFKIEEDAAMRAEALKTAPIVTNTSEKVIPMNRDLSWGIGQVAFMPGLYRGGISKNKPQEISDLREKLLSRGFDVNDVNKLISKMKNGEFSFVNGLSSKEASAITKEDLSLILEYSDKLTAKLKNAKTAAQRRKIASMTDREFKSAYLSSHGRQVYLDKVKNSSVLLNDLNNTNVKPYPLGGYNTGAQKRCKKYLPQLRGNHTPDIGPDRYQERIRSGLYTGFTVEHDYGINYNNASNIDLLLAQNGADSANTLRTGGACLTGTKQSLIGSGAVRADEMSTFNNAFQLAKFLEKHPERFEEIKYVQISDTVAREINAGDLSHLPAGCIVVFGNSSRNDVPGHAAITSGNGQMYADEVDNSNWDNFVALSAKQNGKGEHGYVRVFRLNPKYFTVKDNKLVKA